MKTLLLMRHAKSSFKEGEMPDFERPLSKRGEKDAPRMGKLLKEMKLAPDLILCSTAVRASKTAELLAEKCGYKKEIIYVNSFYLGEPEVYLESLRELSDETECVLLIGHNPGLESLLQILAGKVEPLQTSAIAHLVLPVRSWKAINVDLDTRLMKIWRPKELK